MRLEGFSKRGMELGDDPEQIKKAHQNDLRNQYLDAVKRLALRKMENEIMFEGALGASIRSLTSLGLNVSRESMLKDIQIEIDRQKVLYNFDDIEMNDFSSDLTNINKIDNSLPKKDEQLEEQINLLKRNLGKMFETSQQIETITRSSIPREPAIQSHNDYQEMLDELEKSDVISQTNSINEELEQIEEQQGYMHR